MQIKNLELRNKIIEISRIEFLNYGYKATSFRKIAEKLGISHSNIMTYFVNKEDLFDTLINPATDFIKYSIVDYSDYSNLSDEELLNYLNFSFVKERNKVLFHAIRELREPFILLLFKSNSYDYKNIRTDTQEMFYLNMQAYISELKSRGFIKGSDVSNVFIETLSSLFMVSIEKIILNDLDDSDLKQYAEEMASLISDGTRIMLGGSNEK